MRVFLSSTFADLVEHRAAVNDALERLGHQVGRMEIFGARPEEPATACLEEITRCDLFVGVYARRYGHVAPGSDVSITEQELEWARQHGKPVFCFVLAEDHPWPGEWTEQGEAGARLSRFKARIARSYVVDVFREPLDLAVKVATSLGRYATVHRQLLAIPAVDEQSIGERNDLIKLLESRKDLILFEIEQERSRYPRPSKRKRKTESIDDRRAEALDRVEALFVALHERNIAAIRRGELVHSHQLTGEIHTLLCARDRSAPAEISRIPDVVYRLRIPWPGDYTEMYPPPSTGGPGPMRYTRDQLDRLEEYVGGAPVPGYGGELESKWWRDVVEELGEELEKYRHRLLLERKADQREAQPALLKPDGSVRCPRCYDRFNAGATAPGGETRCPRCRSILRLAFEMAPTEYLEHEFVDDICRKCGCSLTFVRHFGAPCRR
jgi:hypothetical protein